MKFGEKNMHALLKYQHKSQGLLFMFTLYKMKTREFLWTFEVLRLIGHNVNGKFERPPIFREWNWKICGIIFCVLSPSMRVR